MYKNHIHKPNSPTLAKVSSETMFIAAADCAAADNVMERVVDPVRAGVPFSGPWITRA